MKAIDFKNITVFDKTPPLLRLRKIKGLSFKYIDLNQILSEYFEKIHQVDELKVTYVQLDFTRVEPKERIVKIDENGDREIQESSAGQKFF